MPIHRVDFEAAAPVEDDAGPTATESDKLRSRPSDQVARYSLFAFIELFSEASNTSPFLNTTTAQPVSLAPNQEIWRAPHTTVEH